MARTHLWLILLLVAANCAFVAVLHTQLPERVPTHWNMHGQADDWGSKWTFTLLMPSVQAGIAGLMLVLPLLGPLRRNMQDFRVIYGRIAVAISLMLFALSVIIGLKTAGADIPIGTAVAMVLGLSFVVLGNWFGKIRRNFYVGIRTPWTLASDYVWDRTHRLGGRLFVLAGAVVALVAPFVAEWIVFIVLMTCVLGASLWTIVYSYVCYRRHGEKDDLGTPGDPAATRSFEKGTL